MSIVSLESINTGASSLFGEEQSPYISTKKELGKEQFLSLLVAQLKNQDPLNPLDTTQFTAQLAQFSTLEQLISVNKALESINTAQEQTAHVQALNFIGKEIVAQGGMLSLEQGKTCEGGFNLDKEADSTVQITDSNGYPIRTIPLGALRSGQHSFQWDGRDDRGNMRESGVYNFEVTAVDGNNQAVPVKTQVIGKVTGVNLEQNTPLLYVGEIPVAVSQVVEIRVPESVSAGTLYDDGEVLESSGFDTQI